MISILPCLVNLLWVGYLAASAVGENMTSFLDVCMPYELACAHRLMLWSFNHQWSSTDAGSHCGWDTDLILLHYPYSCTRTLVWCPHHSHLWGKGLFDGVKGSPSIRQCVLILALGRFPIDYLMSPKHSTSLDRPTQQRSITGSCLFGILGLLVSLATVWLLKTHRCFHSRAREGKKL